MRGLMYITEDHGIYMVRASYNHRIFYKGQDLQNALSIIRAIAGKFETEDEFIKEYQVALSMATYGEEHIKKLEDEKKAGDKQFSVDIYEAETAGIEESHKTNHKVKHKKAGNHKQVKHRKKRQNHKERAILKATTEEIIF